ncbi:MAG: hypothetical protein QM209_06350 [Candidatus Cloacimonadota bacterium]|jgi:hypothetical protein|nr:hypothetical protein [Candidatus Cloacimonadota bacterium]NLM91210.1 hypothetical protein [Candidatus Cloacimonadota bacterium]HPI42377.1 hypothetical protein [Candidatus Cloacimonas acidaminovorans]HPX57489.1 hypothetical protein [Candidatus Cloacimonas acidaminovorans]HQC08468.1 hypothetical protein [Candidatus Cloacimonas acidaminovorans]
MEDDEDGMLTGKQYQLLIANLFADDKSSYRDKFYGDSCLRRANKGIFRKK